MPKLDGHRKSARDVSGRISTPARTANLYVQTPRWLRPVDRLDYQIRRRLIPLYVEGSVSALGFGFQLRPSKQESAPSETGRRCGNVRRRNPERPRSGWGHFRASPHRNIIGRVTSINRHWRKPNRTLPYGFLAGRVPSSFNARGICVWND